MRYDPIICHRLLFAIQPPADAIRRIGALFDLPGMEGRRVRAQTLHIAVQLLDDSLFYPARTVHAALAAGAAIETPPFDLALDRLAGSHNSVALRPSRRPPALHDLHDAVREACVEAGLPQRDGYRFAPHMTLLHREGTPFTRPIEPIVFRVEQLVLIDRLVGSTRQDLVGQWPLRSGPAPSSPDAPRQYALL